MSNFKKWIPFFGIVLLLFLLLGGCSRKGSLRPNQPPTITITSYGGSDTLSTKLESFQQKIFWEAHDVDGVVKSYAYRVLDINGNPIATSGHQYIDENGWVYHYKEGINVGENTPPPNTPGYGTIWTKDLYALINFPAHDAEGDSANVASIFEVKCIDNRGAESNISSKTYYVNSRVPLVFLTQKDLLKDRTVGQGLAVNFSITDYDIGLQEGDIADHFEFMLKKKSNITGEYMPVDGYYQWYPVYKHNNSYYLELSKDTTPALSINSYNEIYNTFSDSTIFLFRVMDIAGIYSKADSISFSVKTGYHPGTLIYNDNNKADICYALGKYHYTKIQPKNAPSFQNSSGEFFYGFPLFTDLSGERVLIGSRDLKIFMKWGWKGEYEEDNPSGKKQNKVLDEETGKEYFSKIKYFLVRLDNKPLYLPYLPAEGENLFIDKNGKKWLKISYLSSNFQQAILTKSTLEYATGNFYGVHKFEVRAIDLQGVSDPTPAVFVFNIKKYLLPEERTGILVLDNDIDSNWQVNINDIYNELLSDFSGNVDYVYTVNNDNTYVKKISITDYLKYKFIILHSENINQFTVAEQTKLKKMFTVLQMYLDFGGDLMITGGKNLKDQINYLNGENLGNIFETYFGLSMPDPNSDNYAVDVYKDITGAYSDYLKLQFFIGANPIDENYPTLDFDYDNAFDPAVLSEYANPEHALGPVSYIALDNGTAQPIYKFNPIQPGDEPHQISETQYEEVSNFNVAQKKITDKNKCYLFTFPLSYMQIDQAKTLMDKIVNEVMGQ